MVTPSSAPAIRTLAQLRDSGYQPCSVKDELRRNVLARMPEQSLRPSWRQMK
jgi:type IV pilus assembly protein PilY1